MSFDFRKEQDAIAAKAEEEFYNTHDFNREDPSKAERNAQRAFVREAVAKWFATLEPGASIFVDVSQRSVEIRDLWFHGSITVYRPSREYVWSSDENERYKIVPGYVNASSWSAGDSNPSGRNSKDVALEMHNRIRMMELATRYLNDYNEVIVDWVDVENPMSEVRHLRDEVKRYRDIERERAAEAQRKQDARKKK